MLVGAVAAVPSLVLAALPTLVVAALGASEGVVVATFVVVLLACAVVVEWRVGRGGRSEDAGT